MFFLLLIAQEGAAKARSGILSLRSPNRLWWTRRKSALFPHCEHLKHMLRVPMAQRRAVLRFKLKPPLDD